MIPYDVLLKVSCSFAVLFVAFVGGIVGYALGVYTTHTEAVRWGAGSREVDRNGNVCFVWKREEAGK